jgi:predicted dehydrogenase
MKKAWLETGKQCKFIIGFVLRFSPFYQKIREIVHSGQIGKVISMEFNETLSHDHGGYVIFLFLNKIPNSFNLSYIMGDWRRKVEFSGGHILEKTCHDFDLVNWILDTRAKKVASFGGLDIFTPRNQERMQQLGDEYTSWGGLVMVNPFSEDKDIVDNQVAIIEYENGVRSTFHSKNK